jgi:hypothetical protein
MADQTVLRHRTVSTDSAGVSEIVLRSGLDARVPLRTRLADLANHRLWRIDPAANYGPLHALARNESRPRASREAVRRQIWWFPD